MSSLCSSRSLVAALLTVALLATAGCSAPAQRDWRATILDESGAPIPGAVFYAEARDADGPFAFALEAAGEAGEIPRSAHRPGKIAWRADARLTVAAFAPGHLPAIHWSDSEFVPSDGIQFVLREADDPSRLWAPDLMRLGWSPAHPAVSGLDPATVAALQSWLQEAWNGQIAPGGGAPGDASDPRIRPDHAELARRFGVAK